MTFFLDTNICIYFLKGTYPALKENLEKRKPEDIKIPSMVKAELLYGAEKSARTAENTRLITGFLSPFEIVPFGDEATELYGKIRAQAESKGKPVGANDLVIAVTVMAGKGVLVTNDEKEFGRIKGLSVRNWTK